VLSAVKFWKSASISGPSATSKPIERNSAFDAFERARDRMQTATRLTATRQRHIERLFGQSRGQRHCRSASRRALSAASTASLAIDRRTGGLALVRRQFGQTLEQLR
jgi:hypothetical protein